MDSFNLNESAQSYKHLNDKISDFILKIIKSTLVDFKFIQIGRLPKFFDREDTQVVTVNRDGIKMKVWSGFSTQSLGLNDGFFMNIDAVTKFTVNHTVYDDITYLYD